MKVICDYITSDDQTLGEDERRARTETRKDLIDDGELVDQLLDFVPDIKQRARHIDREYYLHIEPDHPGLKCGMCSARADTPIEYGDICPRCNAEKGCDYWP